MRFKTTYHRVLNVFLTLGMLLSLAAPAMAAETSLDAAIEGSAAYMLKTVTDPQVGSVGGEWAVIGLARSGCDVPQSYWDAYYDTVEDYVKDHKGNLHDKKYTEYSRVIVALTAIGADPTNVAGYDLLKPLGDFEKTIWQGINGPIWALIALDSGNYAIPQNPDAETQATREMYVEEILDRQLTSGGWNLIDRGGDGEADPDITGMALQALAGYRQQPQVQNAIDRALVYLSEAQQKDGGYESHENSSSESVVQVIVGLCALDMDLEDPRFVKNGNTLLDNLLSYRQKDGSFLHTSAGGGDSQMASEQGLYGMVAAQRAADGKSTLYKMNDVTIHVTGVTVETVGLPGKHADVKPVPVSGNVSFDDVAGHANQEAIEALASRGIIAGKGDNRFDPDATMTRAEFAAIVVRALGMAPKATNAFSDVSSNAWYAGYVGTAYSYGLITGAGNGRFNPDGTITRQEAAVMVARAAKLCGMDTELENYEILNVLAQFTDYVTIAQWAQEGVAFCYDEDILDQSDLNVEPARVILRCEIAEMLYRMLDSAKLL